MTCCRDYFCLHISTDLTGSYLPSVLLTGCICMFHNLITMFMRQHCNILCIQQFITACTMLLSSSQFCIRRFFYCLPLSRCMFQLFQNGSLLFFTASGTLFEYFTFGRTSCFFYFCFGKIMSLCSNCLHIRSSTGTVVYFRTGLCAGRIFCNANGITMGMAFALFMRRIMGSSGRLDCFATHHFSAFYTAQYSGSFCQTSGKLCHFPLSCFVSDGRYHRLSGITTGSATGNHPSIFRAGSLFEYLCHILMYVIHLTA